MAQVRFMSRQASSAKQHGQTTKGSAENSDGVPGGSRRQSQWQWQWQWQWKGIFIVFFLLASSSAARADVVRTFQPGSLIVPMDTDYQDQGMLQAFGLLYQLLLNDVTVYWSVLPGKSPGDADFYASAMDLETGTPVVNHGYRGGPWIVDSTDATDALPIITQWQAGHDTAVHEATVSFDAHVAKEMVAAPTIAVMADGNEDIAFGYLNAAAIPDSLGNPWPNGKLADYSAYPDIMTPDDIAGTTQSDHDGSLFDPQGLPTYCQIMTMHWDVRDRNEETIRELRAFLQYPTHVFAECQAVNAIENAINGHFLAPQGFIMEGKPPAADIVTMDPVFAQFDGAFGVIGGSEPAYSPVGGQYYDMGIVMITKAGTPVGDSDIWMTGYIDGQCSMGEASAFCSGIGKVSYLGGHRYDTKLPISANPKTVGTKLFLNSLFEAGCVTEEGQPGMSLTKSGPALVTDSNVHYDLTAFNSGPGIALDVTVTDSLPQGAALVSATPSSCTESAGTVTCSLGNLGPGQSVAIGIDITLPAFGTYSNQAFLQFRVGLNHKMVQSQVVQTTYQQQQDASIPDAGLFDAQAMDAASEDAALIDAGLIRDDASQDDAGRDGTVSDAGWNSVASGTQRDGALQDGAWSNDAASHAIVSDGAGLADGMSWDSISPDTGQMADGTTGQGDAQAITGDGATSDGSWALDALGDGSDGGGANGMAKHSGCDCRTSSGRPSSSLFLWLLVMVMVGLRIQMRRLRL